MVYGYRSLQRILLAMGLGFVAVQANHPAMHVAASAAKAQQLDDFFKRLVEGDFTSLPINAPMCASLTQLCKNARSIELVRLPSQRLGSSPHQRALACYMARTLVTGNRSYSCNRPLIQPKTLKREEDIAAVFAHLNKEQPYRELQEFLVNGPEVYHIVGFEDRDCFGVVVYAFEDEHQSARNKPLPLPSLQEIQASANKPGYEERWSAEAAGFYAQLVTKQFNPAIEEEIQDALRKLVDTKLSLQFVDLKNVDISLNDGNLIFRYVQPPLPSTLYEYETVSLCHRPVLDDAEYDEALRYATYGEGRWLNHFKSALIEIARASEETGPYHLVVYENQIGFGLLLYKQLKTVGEHELVSPTQTSVSGMTRVTYALQ
jgi:hypothetical protein